MKAGAWIRIGLSGVSVTALCLAIGAAGAATFDLRGLPRYAPAKQLNGTIRLFGSSLGGLVTAWESGFRRIQPGIRFENRFPSSDAGIAGLVAGVADLGPQAREQTLVERLMFFETFGHPAGSIAVATGGYDVEGMADGLVIFVQKDNPLSKLTMQQLDGIFGAQRTGGFRGFKWSLRNGRAAAENIRTWGQLGLKGAWADREIHTYGYAPTGMSNFFQLNVLHGGDKWNPNYREYVESGTKMIGDGDRSGAGGLRHMLADRLAHDRFGIAYGVLSQAKGIRGVKVIALAARPGGPYVPPSPQSFQDHSYPLSRSIYMYFNRVPGRALAPQVSEFLRFILSRDAQRAVERHGGYLPLTPALAQRGLEGLE